MITLEQAKNLKPGDILHHAYTLNADGTPERWMVNGKPQTWKSNPGRVRVPLKHGLHHHDYLTEHTLHLVNLGG